MKSVSIETAEALKELGYVGPYEYCWTSFNGEPVITECEALVNVEIGDDAYVYPAPTLEDAANWIRTAYGIHISVRVEEGRKDTPHAFNYTLDIYDHLYGWHGGWITSWGPTTYEEALSDGLKSAIREITLLEIPKNLICTVNNDPRKI